MKKSLRVQPFRRLAFAFSIVLFTIRVCLAATLSGSFTDVPSGSIVNLSSVGEIDWVHWGLYTETSLNRKDGVVHQISDFTVLDAPMGYAYVYQYSDNANGYSWSDGTPVSLVTNTTTGVWAYGVPQIGSGFQISAPADQNARTLKVYVGSYAARGKMEAFLSDSSTRGYTNTTLFNMTSGPGGVFSFNYAAASSGQKIIIRWTLQNAFRADGNVTLQAAALTSSTANNPPFVALTSPSQNTSFTSASTIPFTVNASDTDGAIELVEFYANGVRIGEDSTSPYTLDWRNVAAGNYVLTAVATDNQGESSTSDEIEIFVHGAGGSLTGSRLVAPNFPSSVNLTADGLADWTHWGLATNSMFNRKTGTASISNYQKLGTNAVDRYEDNYTGFTWNNGSPTASAVETTTGIFSTGFRNGFEITAPAGTTPRTLKIYAGLYGAQANVQAWLGDFSAPAFTDLTLSNVFGNGYAVYTLTYAAASNGGTLTFRIRSEKIYDQDFGNVTLQAATLVQHTGQNLNPSVSIGSPVDGSTFAAPATVALAANATDPDGAIVKVEFFNGAAKLGEATAYPYSFNWTNVGVGAYTLRALATDEGGATATSTPVSISVTNPPPQPVQIIKPIRQGSNFIFSFQTSPGRLYQIQYRNVLSAGSWVNLESMTGDGNIVNVTNLNAPLPERYYRVESK